jgi:RNA polymerase sigma-70 factor (ECF subfamily)
LLPENRVDEPAIDPLEWLGGIARTERASLAGIARSEGLTAEEALECVQDALSTMLARERAEISADAEHAVATLRTIVRNAARNHRRKHHRAKPHLPVEACCETRADGVTPEDAIAHAEEIVRLRTCVSELCGVQRAVVTLRLLDERSGEDVARELGLTRGHVDVIVHRAKDALRACILRSA